MRLFIKISRGLARARCLCLLVAGPLASSVANAGTVYETPAEFIGSGDFNGDGLLDAVVLDKFTGNARAAYQLPGGALVWSVSMPSGVPNAGSLAVGRFSLTGSDGIGVASSDLNKVIFLNVGKTNAAPPVSFLPAGIGPDFLVGLKTPFGFSTNLDWLLIGSINNDTNLSRVELSPVPGNLAGSGYSDAANQPWTFSDGNSVSFGANPVSFAAAIAHAPTNDLFVALAPSNHFALTLVQSNLPPGSRYAFGQVASESLPRFIFYVPGQSNLTLRSISPTAAEFAFNAPVNIAVSEAIQQVYYVAQGTDGIFMINFGDGIQGLKISAGGATLASIYRSGLGAAGNVVTGVVPLGSGNFTVFDGPASSLSSAHVQVVNFNGTTYTQLSSGNLPALTSRTTRANVWLFQSEPFVNPDPGFISSLTAPDWSSAVFGLPGSVSVRVEADGGPSAGLGTSSTNNLGPAPTLTTFAIPDQYQDAISLFSYSSPRAVEPVRVNISPPPGLYGAPISMSLSTVTPASTLLYKLGAGDGWHLYSAPIALSNTVAVQYYGTNASARSRLYAANYDFGRSGAIQAPTINLDPSATNPAPIFNTNQIYLSGNGTVFYSRRSANGVGTIWAINLDGSSETYITTGARPRASRDGRFIVFVRDLNNGGYFGDVWVRDLYAGTERQLYTNLGQLILGCDWNNTGDRIFFDYACVLWSMDLNGVATILDLPALCGQGSPVVNPVSGLLAFAKLTSPDPGSGIALTFPAGGVQQPAVGPAVGASWPAWSPDGSLLCWADNNFYTIESGRNLWVSPPDGSQFHQITGFTDNVNGFPKGAVWSPDGSALVGAGTIFGTNGLWVIPLSQDRTDCFGPPILLPTSPGDFIDFAGSVVAPLLTQTTGPVLHIRTNDTSITVYWSASLSNYVLEATSPLVPPAWGVVPPPYTLNISSLDGPWLEHTEPLSSLLSQKFFRLHLTPTPLSPNLVYNGGFEQQSYPGDGDIYSTDANFDLPGWTFPTGNGQFFLEYGNPFGVARRTEGRQAVCLNGENNGSILSQLVPTVSGRNYILSFAQGDEQAVGPSASQLTVSVGDLSQGFARTNDSGFVYKSLAFTAVTNSTLLQFADATPATAAANSPFIDDVTLMAGSDEALRAGTNTLFGAGALVTFTAPGASAGNFAFYAPTSLGPNGLFGVFNGLLARIADSNTPMPGGQVNFVAFTGGGLGAIGPSVSGNHVAFFGYAQNAQGIYLSSYVSLSRVADLSTPIPDGAGNFTDFNTGDFTMTAPCVSGNNVAFYGAGNNGQKGIFALLGGRLGRIASLATPIPGGTGAFQAFSAGTSFVPNPAISGNNVVFFGAGLNGQQGIYASRDGAVVRIADRNTLAPGSNLTFDGFVPDAGVNVEPAIEGLNVAFRAVRSDGVQGLYVSFDGTLAKVADSNDRVPGGAGTFSGFRSVALAGGCVVFLAVDAANQPGLYQWNGKYIKRLVGLGDVINGKTVNSLLFTRGGLDGASATSLVYFTDQSVSICVSPLLP